MCAVVPTFTLLSPPLWPTAQAHLPQLAALALSENTEGPRKTSCVEILEYQLSYTTIK